MRARHATGLTFPGRGDSPGSSDASALQVLRRPPRNSRRASLSGRGRYAGVLTLPLTGIANLGVGSFAASADFSSDPRAKCVVVVEVKSRACRAFTRLFHAMWNCAKAFSIHIPQSVCANTLESHPTLNVKNVLKQKKGKNKWYHTTRGGRILHKWTLKNGKVEAPN